MQGGIPRMGNGMRGCPRCYPDSGDEGIQMNAEAGGGHEAQQVGKIGLAVLPISDRAEDPSASMSSRSRVCKFKPATHAFKPATHASVN